MVATGGRFDALVVRYQKTGLQRRDAHAATTGKKPGTSPRPFS